MLSMTSKDGQFKQGCQTRLEPRVLAMDRLYGRPTHASPSLHVVDLTHPEGAEEVDGLAGEGVDNGFDLTAGDAVVLEDAHAHADAVLAGWVPVVLLHASVTDQRRVQRREIVTCNLKTSSVSL